MESRAQLPVGLPSANPTASYWQITPSPLANLIEPEPEQRSQNAATGTGEIQPYEYAIVGSGISGTLCAYNILQRQPSSRIVMLDARSACSGATGRNGGHTKAASYRMYLQHKRQFGKDEALRIARFEYENIVATHRLAEELGIKDECESCLCQTVDLIYDQQTFEEGRAAIAELVADADPHEREGGMADYKIHSAEEAAEKFYAAARNSNPAVEGEEHLAGAFSYLAGRIHAYRFTTAILKHCVVNHGLQLCTNTPVLRIEDPSPDAQDPYYILHTPRFPVHARTLILATNGYTPHLLPSFQSSIVPLRGQITAQRPPKETRLPPLLPTTYSFIYRHGYEYMIPRPVSSSPPDRGPGCLYLPSTTTSPVHESQHLLIGGGIGRLPAHGASEYGTTDDTTLNPQISDYLLHSLPGYFGPETWGPEPDANTALTAAAKQSEQDRDTLRAILERDPDFILRGCYHPSMATLMHQPPSAPALAMKAQAPRIVAEWTGIMGATPDGMPFVGPVPGRPNMFITAGFNGHGMVLCLKSAEALVRIMFARAKGWGTDERPRDRDVDSWKGREGCLPWFPRAFLVSEGRLREAFEGRRDLVGEGEEVVEE